MYHVIAGKYEQNGDENVKVADYAFTYRAAEAIYASVKTYPFARIEDENGHVLLDNHS